MLTHKHLGNLIAVHAWHAEVDHDYVNRLPASESNAGRAVGCGQDSISLAFQQSPMDLKKVAIIINVENRYHGKPHRMQVKLIAY